MPVCPIFLCLRLAFLPTEETKMRQLRKRGWFVVDNQMFAFWWKIAAKTEILPVFFVADFDRECAGLRQRVIALRR